MTKSAPKLPRYFTLADYTALPRTEKRAFDDWLRGAGLFEWGVVAIAMEDDTHVRAHYYGDNAHTGRRTLVATFDVPRIPPEIRSLLNGAK